MRHESTKHIYASWLRQKGAAAALERALFDPTEIGRHLRDVFLLEKGAGTDFRFRIAGASLCALFGRELRGADFLSVLTHAALEDGREILTAATEEVRPVVAGICAILPEGRSVEAELLLLPMRYEGRTDARLFGALSYVLGDRHLLGACAGLDMLSFRIIGDHDVPMLMPPAASAIHGAGFERRAHLTVYNGGLQDSAS